MSEKKCEFFQFRINKIKINDNREKGKYAEVKLVSFITKDDVSLPPIDRLLVETDPTKQAELIRDAAALVLSSKILTEIDKVTDNFTMTFGPVGYALYTANKIPTSFNWAFHAIECDGDTRRTGELIDGIVKLPEFDNFAKKLVPTLIGFAASAPYLAGIEISKFIGEQIANLLKNKKDDQLGVLYLTFNKFEHYPHGIRNDTDILDLSRNIMVDYSIFGTIYQEEDLNRL